MTRFVIWATFAAFLMTFGCTTSGDSSYSSYEESPSLPERSRGEGREESTEGSNDLAERTPQGEGREIYRAGEIPCSAHLGGTVHTIAIHTRTPGQWSMSWPLWEMRTIEPGHGGSVQTHPIRQPAGERMDLGMSSDTEAGGQNCWYRFGHREAEGACSLSDGSSVTFTVQPASCDSDTSGTLAVSSTTISEDGDVFTVETNGQHAWYDTKARARVALGTCNGELCEVIVQYNGDDSSQAVTPQRLTPN